MKLSRGGIGFVLLLGLACSPENKEVRTEQVHPEETAAPTDSAVKPEKDGTATVQTHTTPRLPIPQPALQLLSEKYPEWREPVLLEEAVPAASSEEQGPLLVKGNFDGNELQDIALQFRHQKNIVIVALLQDSSQWQLHELKKDILFNDRGTYKSLYFVYLTEAGSKIYNYKTRQNFTTPYDAVSVGIDNRSTTFVYEKGKFVAYDTGD